MSPRERFRAALELKAVDRVPLFYQHLGAAKWLLQSTGLRIHDGLQDPETFARLSLAAHDMYGFDNVMAGWGDLLTEAKAHGMEWKFPERDFYPRPDRYVDMSEIDKVQPVDPMDDPTWSVPLKAARIMMERVGGEVAVVGAVCSPNLVASEIVGMENLMMGSLTDPDGVGKLLGTVTQSLIRYGEIAKEIGIEEVFIEGSTAGGEMVDPSMYEQFDGQYLRQVIDAYRGGGLRTLVHNCTEKPLWKEQLAARPTAIHLQLASVDLGEVAAAVKGQTCFIAGIEHRELLLNRTPDEVEAAVTSAMEAWGQDPGLILGPGCELPYKTPVENIRQMKESVERITRTA